jgi:hypothetical protein
MSIADVNVARNEEGLPKRLKRDVETVEPLLLLLLLKVVVTASSLCANTPDALGIDKDEVTVANVLCNIVTAGLSAVELPPSGTATSFDPHITMSIGNNFGQLLTNNAVLTALALGGDGGGSG